MKVEKKTWVVYLKFAGHLKKFSPLFIKVKVYHQLQQNQDSDKYSGNWRDKSMGRLKLLVEKFDYLNQFNNNEPKQSPYGLGLKL